MHRARNFKSKAAVVVPRLVALLLIVWTTSAPAQGTDTEPSHVQAWQAISAMIQEGDLKGARIALGQMKLNGRDETRWRDRLNAAIERRHRLAEEMLVKVANDLGQHHVNAAGQRVDVAVWLDKAAANASQARAVRNAQRALADAIVGADACVQQLSSICLNNALSRVRAIDVDNADALMMELAAHDWYRPETSDAHGQFASLDGPTK